MQREERREKGVTRRTGALMVASGAVFIVGALSLPEALANLFEADTLAQKYASVAAHDGAYRWANIAVAAAALLAAIATGRLSILRRAPKFLEKTAVAGFAVATLGWVVEGTLRATTVVDRAADLAADKVAAGTALTDRAIEGDSLFAVPSLLGALALLVLALSWGRSGVIGRPTAVALGIGAVVGAAFVRSDPIAITLIPPFPFVIGFLPTGIALMWRNRASCRRAEALESAMPLR